MRTPYIKHTHSVSLTHISILKRDYLLFERFYDWYWKKKKKKRENETSCDYWLPTALQNHRTHSIISVAYRLSPVGYLLSLYKIITFSTHDKFRFSDIKPFYPFRLPLENPFHSFLAAADLIELHTMQF